MTLQCDPPKCPNPPQQLPPVIANPVEGRVLV